MVSETLPLLMLQERLMEEIMKVDADLTSVDYETFFAVATRKAFRGRAVRVRSGLILIVSIVLLVSFILIAPSFFPASPFIQLALLFILYASSVHFWNRYSRRIMAPQQNGPLLGPHTFFLTPEGFEDHGNLSFSRTTWSAVQAIQETPQHLYVFIDKTAAHIIPRRSF